MDEKKIHEAMTAKCEELVAKINQCENRFCIECDEATDHTCVMRRQDIWWRVWSSSEHDLTFAWKCTICANEVEIATFRV